MSVSLLLHPYDCPSLQALQTGVGGYRVVGEECQAGKTLNAALQIVPVLVAAAADSRSVVASVA